MSFKRTLLLIVFKHVLTRSQEWYYSIKIFLFVYTMYFLLTVISTFDLYSCFMK